MCFLCVTCADGEEAHDGPVMPEGRHSSVTSCADGLSSQPSVLHGRPLNPSSVPSSLGFPEQLKEERLEPFPLGGNGRADSGPVEDLQLLDPVEEHQPTTQGGVWRGSEHGTYVRCNKHLRAGWFTGTWLYCVLCNTLTV